MISVSENDFKDKVSIRFNNITEGINRFENKTLESDKSDDFEKSLIGFLEEAVKLNGVENSYVDFYYNILEEDQKNKFKDFLSLEDKDFLKIFEEENSKGGIYYNLSLESIPFIVKITAQEILFSTIYFTKEPFTIWGNYNKKLPIFYNDEVIFNKYNSIAKIFNLKMV
jgi:succinate dehydrogenase flavin-adding protein (antitoxin of CptAB toxin-antitoxin module)